MMRKLFFALLAASVFAGCDNGDDAPKEIALTDGTSTAQTVYADETSSAGGIKFKAVAPWTAAVTEVAARAESGDLWLTLSAYSGEAGEFSLGVMLEKNTTGRDRRAEIKITCGGTTITIILEQKGVTKEEEEDPVQRVDRLVSKFEWLPGQAESSSQELEYDDKNRLVKLTYSDDPAADLFAYEGNTIRLTSGGKLQKLITLEQGRAVLAEDKQEDYKESFTYSGDYLVSSTETYNGGREDKSTFSWTGGNLTSIQSSGGALITLEYGNAANHPTSVNIPLILTTGVGYGTCLNLNGQQSENLPVRQTVTGDMWSEGNGVTEFRYETDDHGSVTAVYCREKDADAVDFGKEYLYLKITYRQ